MTKPAGQPMPVIVDGHDTSHHVIGVQLNTPIGGMRTLVIELANPTADTNPETGAITFRIGDTP